MLEREEGLGRASCVVGCDTGTQSASELLRASARARLRHSGSSPSSPSAEVALWRAVIAGEWSLVDRFEASGRPVMLARRNDPRTAARKRLSDRQRETAALAAQGRSIKFIAYEVGVARATVTTSIDRSLAKLGLRRRIDLASIPVEAFQ